jgi:hypothetical protein
MDDRPASDSHDERAINSMPPREVRVMAFLRSRLFLWPALNLLIAVAVIGLPPGGAAQAQTTTVCLRSQVPSGYVIIGETYQSGCLGSSAYVITLPPRDGTTTAICHGNIADVPSGFVIVGQTSQGPCDGFLEGTWIILAPLTNGTTTAMCKGNLAGVPRGFVVVGETSSGPCDGFLEGTWIIRTPAPNGITVICRVNLGQIPAGFQAVGGSTSGGPCSSLRGTWQIAPIP